MNYSKQIPIYINKQEYFFTLRKENIYLLFNLLVPFISTDLYS